MSFWYHGDPLQVQLRMCEWQAEAEQVRLVRLARAGRPRTHGYLRRHTGALLIAAGEALACTCQEAPCPECV